MSNNQIEPQHLDDTRINFLLTKALFIAINQLKRTDVQEQVNDANDMQIVLDTKFKRCLYSGNVIEWIDKSYKPK